MLKDIAVHSVKLNRIMNRIIGNTMKRILNEACAVSWRYVVGVAEVLNIVHELIQGPKLPAINLLAMQ